MPTVRYTVIDGEVITEKRGGVRRTYVPDPLGSTIALLDNNHVGEGCKKGDLITIGIDKEGAYKSCGTHSGIISEVNGKGLPTKVILCSEVCKPPYSVCEVDLASWLKECKARYGKCRLMGCGGVGIL